MDRPRSPLLEDAQRQFKKGQNFEALDYPQESDMVDNDQSLGAMFPPPQKVSFRDMLIGDMREQSYTKSLGDLDVDVLEEDVRCRDDGGVASGVLAGGHGRSMAPTESSKRLSGNVVETRKIDFQKIISGSNHQNDSELAREKVQTGKPVVKLPAIASRDKVIPVDTSLSLENHVVVHVDNTRGGPKSSVSNA
ncbi:hypothetical protein V6N12_027561 [Hibiscus sabdariffa]|uniref:Uncharacterized protein n=1 Tax=Hibiscus sabdariffa TaxID=183260 RepID=A0ABR2F375_9ROSI